MGFPNTPILDVFNRANESPIGGNWTSNLGGAGAGAAITNNQVNSDNTPPANPSAWWSAQLFGPDCEAWIQHVADLGSGESFSLFARVSNPSGAYNGYQVGLGFDGSLNIGRRDGGVYTFLNGTTVTASTGDYIGISCVRNVIEAWHCPVGTKAWVLSASAVDSTWADAGYLAFGFIVNDFNTALDNFGGGTIPQPRIMMNHQTLGRARGG